MINFDRLERDLPLLSEAFFEAKPYSHIVIDGFADEDKLLKIIAALPTPGKDAINKSRDYIFAKNKFEKSDFEALSAECAELRDDFLSERFRRLIGAITGEEVFIDPEFHGGGVHQGGENSFLDMHVDFNYHPLHSTWFRNLNILLYLNHNWRPEYRGQLKLKEPNDRRTVEVEPLFNRCVIMLSRDYTLHGYDQTNFPKGAFRRSIAAYAYSLHEAPEAARTTKWVPEQASLFKRTVNVCLPTLLKAKHAVFGSGTAKNR